MTGEWLLANTFVVETFKEQPLCKIHIYNTDGTLRTEFYFNAALMAAFVGELKAYRAGITKCPSAEDGR